MARHGWRVGRISLFVVLSAPSLVFAQSGQALDGEDRSGLDAPTPGLNEPLVEEPATAAEPAPPDTGPRVFLEGGASLGIGWATRGRLADSPPDGSGDETSYIPGSDPTCDHDVTEYCVRVQVPGAILAPALRFSVGVAILPRLLVGATLRYQLNAGSGTLAHFLIGIRTQIRLGRLRATGLFGGIHLGQSVGQIQLQPIQNGSEEPYIISGLMGVQAGGALGYRFTRNVGLVFTPEAHVLFPVFLFAFDFTLSMHIGFG